MKKIQRKPEWLKKKLFYTPNKQNLDNIFQNLNINTICESARCPNKSECYSKKTATFLLMGNICTRNCRFCSVPSATTKMVQEKKIALPDEQEPEKIAALVKKMDLEYVVLTSVDRDDLEDLGVGFFIRTIEKIRQVQPKIKIEVLTPDFQGRRDIIKEIIDAKVEIYNHNMETVESLSPKIRRKSDYFVSLSMLETLKSLNPNSITKTGIMLGFGEKEEEVFRLFEDVKKVGCDILTIGQYLQPTAKNIEVHEYISLNQFKKYKEKALSIGIPLVYSGPFVRSSYQSLEAYNKIIEIRAVQNSSTQ